MLPDIAASLGGCEHPFHFSNDWKGAEHPFLFFPTIGRVVPTRYHLFSNGWKGAEKFPSAVAKAMAGQDDWKMLNGAGTALSNDWKKLKVLVGRSVVFGELGLDAVVGGGCGVEGAGVAEVLSGAGDGDGCGVGPEDRLGGEGFGLPDVEEAVDAGGE